MPKILITGGSSLLGRALIETAPPEHEIAGTWYTNAVGPLVAHQMDVTNKSQVSYIFDRIKPDIVIHCAANGSVDHAERNYQEVHSVNVGGTENVLFAAQDCDAKVIFISTNAVYDGDHPPYDEKDACFPVNVYGSIKRQAERLVKLNRHWVIIRPFLLYGWPWTGGRLNWANIIIDALSKGKALKLVNDTIWQPTYAPDCARAIWQLIESDNEIYNVAPLERFTLHDFGLAVANTFGLNESLIEPVRSDAFPTIAKRPKDTTYNTNKINNLGVKLFGAIEGLNKMREDTPILERKDKTDT